MKKCNCGKPATITLGFGAKEVIFCDACFKLACSKLKADMRKANREAATGQQ